MLWIPKALETSGRRPSRRSRFVVSDLWGVRTLATKCCHNVGQREPVGAADRQALRRWLQGCTGDWRESEFPKMYMSEYQRSRRVFGELHDSNGTFVRLRRSLVL